MERGAQFVHVPHSGQEMMVVWTRGLVVEMVSISIFLLPPPSTPLPNSIDLE